MGLLSDHTAREMLSDDAGPATNGRTGADRLALKSRPPPSRRVPTTMPHAVCLRIAGAWIAALAVLLAIVLTIRGQV